MLSWPTACWMTSSAAIIGKAKARYDTQQRCLARCVFWRGQPFTQGVEGREVGTATYAVQPVQRLQCGAMATDMQRETAPVRTDGVVRLPVSLQRSRVN